MKRLQRPLARLPEAVHHLECIHRADAILGESPLWSPQEDVLYWLDILRPAIYRFAPGVGQTGVWPMPSAVGAMGLCIDKQLIVALEREGLCFFQPTNGGMQPFVDPVAACGGARELGRYNDGQVDARGNFWLGWLTHTRKSPGALFRIEPSGEVHKVLDDPFAPNGLGWSPDGHIMYVTDSHINTIWAYDCDLATGELGARRLLARQARGLGVFDGLSVDESGNVWTALYGGAAVVGFSPSGRRIGSIAMPVKLVTACTFGGPELKHMYITTAIRGQRPKDLQGQPLAGALFSQHGPHGGSAPHYFANGR